MMAKLIVAIIIIAISFIGLIFALFENAEEGKITGHHAFYGIMIFISSAIFGATITTLLSLM